MKAIEFYIILSGEVTLKQVGEAEKQLTESDVEFIQAFMDVLKEFYPGAYNALMETY